MLYTTGAGAIAAAAALGQSFASKCCLRFSWWAWRHWEIWFLGLPCGVSEHSSTWQSWHASAFPHPTLGSLPATMDVAEWLSAVLALKKDPCSQTEPLWAALVLCERLRNRQMWKLKAACHPTWLSIALHCEWVILCVSHRVADCTSQHQFILWSVLHLY